MSEPSEELSTAEYLEKFGDKAKIEKALECALDIRKFEIELYWKRATYFWTFIGLIFGGYGTLQTASDSGVKAHLSILLTCLGFVFSFGWFCVNKGSKKWQENWERNVDLLENEIIGPLFKTVWDKKQPAESADCMKKIHAFATYPGRFSGSKINQVISLAITALWIILWGGEVWATLSMNEQPDGVCVATSIGSAVTCYVIWTHGTPGKKAKSFWHPDDVDK